jgi:hypothetical protein
MNRAEFLKFQKEANKPSTESLKREARNVGNAIAHQEMHRGEIKITRYKHYKRGQIGPAWNWNYTVISPGEYDAGTFTLNEAEIIAKKRQKKTGFPIIKDWEV